MIENLKFEAPHVWKLIRELLIGNKGRPDERGDAAGGYVHDAELKYNATPGEYWYRFIRPVDKMINDGSGATEHEYSYTYTTATEEDLFATDQELTVQTRESVVCFGWYCDVDLGKGGYLEIQEEGVPKVEVPARIVYRQKSPDFFYFDLDHIFQAYENANLSFKAYNSFGSDRDGMIVPLIYRIAPRSALNLEKVRYRNV